MDMNNVILWDWQYFAEYVIIMGNISNNIVSSQNNVMDMNNVMSVD